MTVNFTRYDKAKNKDTEQLAGYDDPDSVRSEKSEKIKDKEGIIKNVKKLGKPPLAAMDKKTSKGDKPPK